MICSLFIFMFHFSLSRFLDLFLYQKACALASSISLWSYSHLQSYLFSPLPILAVYSFYHITIEFSFSPLLVCLFVWPSLVLPLSSFFLFLFPHSLFPSVHAVMAVSGRIGRDGDTVPGGWFTVWIEGWRWGGWQLRREVKGGIVVMETIGLC